MEKTSAIAGYECRTIEYNASGIPIVFLHGLSYNVEIWQRIGLTELLRQKHIPYLALDMPYGIRSHCQPRTRSPDKNVAVVNEAVKVKLNSAVPLLVGASIGGNIALHYAAAYPVKGLFLVAPARSLDPNLVPAYRKFSFPTTIVWGSEDNVVAGEDMRTLEDKLPNAKLMIYQGANHSAYKDQPERFGLDLLELYVRAEQS